MRSLTLSSLSSRSKMTAPLWTGLTMADMLDAFLAGAAARDAWPASVVEARDSASRGP
jgi:hypothetical protein